MWEKKFTNRNGHLTRWESGEGEERESQNTNRKEITRHRDIKYAVCVMTDTQQQQKIQWQSYQTV